MSRTESLVAKPALAARLRRHLASGIVAAAYVGLLACASPTRADEKPAPRTPEGVPAAASKPGPDEPSKPAAKVVRYTLVRYRFHFGFDPERKGPADPEEAVVERRELTRDEVATLVAPFGSPRGIDGEAHFPLGAGVDPKTLDEPALRAAIEQYNGLLGGAAMRRSIPDVVTRIDVTEVDVQP